MKVVMISWHGAGAGASIIKPGNHMLSPESLFCPDVLGAHKSRQAPSQYGLKLTELHNATLLLILQSETWHRDQANAHEQPDIGQMLAGSRAFKCLQRSPCCTILRPKLSQPFYTRHGACSYAASSILQMLTVFGGAVYRYQPATPG